MKKLTRPFLFIIIFLLATNLVFCQKYMIKGNDTLPYKADMVISNDTVRNGNTILIKSDTEYTDPCHVFEKIKGQIVNRTDKNCLQQGLWIVTDSIENYSTSIYTDGENQGKWKKYSKDGNLLKEVEEVNLGNEFFIVKEIDYSSGHPLTIVNVPFFGFYIRHFSVVILTLVFLIICRILLNYRIYNSENNTNYASFGSHFSLKMFEPGELRHRLLSVFTLWFFKYKPDNRNSVIVSNILSVICFGSILIFLLGPLFCR